MLFIFYGAWNCRLKIFVTEASQHHLVLNNFFENFFCQIFDFMLIFVPFVVADISKLLSLYMSELHRLLQFCLHICFVSIYLTSEARLFFLMFFKFFIHLPFKVHSPLAHDSSRLFKIANVSMHGRYFNVHRRFILFMFVPEGSQESCQSGILLVLADKTRDLEPIFDDVVNVLANFDAHYL